MVSCPQYVVCVGPHVETPALGAPIPITSPDTTAKVKKVKTRHYSGNERAAHSELAAAGGGAGSRRRRDVG